MKKIGKGIKKGGKKHVYSKAKMKQTAMPKMPKMKKV